MPGARKPIKKKPDTFRMVEFGAGNARTIEKKALRDSEGHYIAVDPIYRRTKVPLAIPKSPRSMESFIKEMKRRKVHAEKLVLNTPNVTDIKTKRMKIDYLFKEAQNILTKNGKIFITSEHPDLIDLVEFLAKDNGLKLRAKRELKQPSTEVQQQLMKQGVKVQMVVFSL